MKALFTVLLHFLSVVYIRSWNEGSVLLRDVQALTLYRDRYTTARRSSPVMQLQCVGGSAGCHAFIPEVVQCQNKGWDGVDVQWECKTDMETAFKFGRIEVTCEGFSHPDDPYVLRGSCGLEYTLELTGEGRKRPSAHGPGFFSSFFSDSSSNHHHQGNRPQPSSPEGDGGGGLFVLALLLFLAFGVYKLFLSGPNHGQPNNQNNFQHPTGPHHTGPPPPGFKPDFTGPSAGNTGYGFSTDPGYGSSTDPGYGSSTDPGYGYSSRAQHRGGLGGNGFWTGMGTGGVLGYLFGSQRRQPNMHTGPTWGKTWGNTWGNSSGPPAPSPSGVTRTTSGFGGTKRR